MKVRGKYVGEQNAFIRTGGTIKQMSSIAERSSKLLTVRPASALCGTRNLIVREFDAYGLSREFIAGAICLAGSERENITPIEYDKACLSRGAGVDSLYIK